MHKFSFQNAPHKNTTMKKTFVEGKKKRTLQITLTSTNQPTMDIILGIKVSDGTLIATSKAATRGISILKDTDDKTRHLNAHNLIAYTGEAGDTVQFAEYVQANIQLYSMRENDIELSPKATASFRETNWPVPLDLENRTR